MYYWNKYWNPFGNHGTKREIKLTKSPFYADFRWVYDRVSFRDELYRIMNWQHTVETVASKSGSRDTPVRYMIYLGLTYDGILNVPMPQVNHRCKFMDDWLDDIG